MFVVIVGYSTNLNKCHRNETICALFLRLLWYAILC